MAVLNHPHADKQSADFFFLKNQDLASDILLVPLDQASEVTGPKSRIVPALKMF